uniref:PiggyBac transposable element-derived protein domain-containing protein n=1 Tax=Amphimedon queenslandica TaxID=400682 RepID=A0A1X7TJJ1_AMPQE
MAHRSFSAEEVLESVTNDTNDYIFDGSDDELGFEDTSDDDRFTEVSVESEIEEVIADLQERNGEMEHSGTMELTENAAIQDTCRQKEHMEEEMEHDGGSTELSWSDLLEPVSYENFKDEKGPTTALPATPLEVFRLFFNSTITELLVTETNRYASLCLGEESSLLSPSDPSYDRLCKVRKFLTLIEDRFVSLYNPHCQCAVDEYMPMKPVIKGIKVWARADSTNGYISRFQVYTGKEDSSEVGLGNRVVKDLTSDIHHRSHQVFCDSITLQSRRNPQLTVSVWQDTKPVTVSSTFCQTVPLHSVSRKLRTGQHSVFPCPEAITQYNRYMGGVDCNDQLRQYYHVHRKYHKYIFWMLFDITITNSFVLSSHVIPCSNTKDFRTMLAKALLQGYCSHKKRGRKPLSIEPFRPDHFPLKGDGKQHPCQYCKLIYGIRRETTWHCQDCNTYLCHRGDAEKDCFLFHKKYC